MVDTNIAHLKLTISELKIKLDTVCAQNERLSEENARLKHENNRLKTDCNVSSNINIDSRMRLHHLESEREDLTEALRELKIKYDKLCDRYTTKTRREKALELFYKKQNSMPFVVPRNSISDSTIETTTINHNSSKGNPIEESSDLQKKLTEANDKIADLEFELESVDFLESENEKMRKELNRLKLDNHGQPQDVISRSSASSDETVYANVNEPYYDVVQSLKVKVTSRNFTNHPLQDNVEAVSDTAAHDDETKVDDAPELRDLAYKRALLKKQFESVLRKK